ncbi:LysR family transcriptional regulator [Acinetobacter ursingii]|uniref:LysR family transcriptional regulator n=1 Tax=Acinetobacter ursingii TaxID=108980 RepID=UPI001250B2A8|nr:LysR family transcriptional regulator [Acinetobacter ursingii]
MITFKQMEALTWICKLGGFEAAADKLHMSQSAISKRIHELESSFDIEIFDRSNRNAKLTEQGRELLIYCQEILERRDVMLEKVSDKKVLISRLRLGVTELTAMTWLPDFIEKIRQIYPRVHIEPTVEVSRVLFENIINDQLDIIIAPDMYDDVRLKSLPLKSVENVWMCSPKLIPKNKNIDFEQASREKFSFFVQGATSGTDLIYERYFLSQKITLNKNIICNSLMAQLGLTISGMGITYLPLKPLEHLINSDKLRILNFTPRLPLIKYSAIYRSDRDSGIVPEIAEIAVKTCHFDKFLIG